MIGHLAPGIQSACAWTRIYTFLIFAGSVLWAIRAQNTFWSTRWWGTTVTRHARANSMTVDFPALAVGSTWWWLTRICPLYVSLNWLLETKEKDKNKEDIIICYLKNTELRNQRVKAGIVYVAPEKKYLTGFNRILHGIFKFTFCCIFKQNTEVPFWKQQWYKIDKWRI